MLSSFWSKLKTACLNSATIATGYASLIIGEIIGNIDAVAEVFGDPQLHDQIQSLIGHDPKIAAGYAKVYGIVMIAARLRSKIAKKS